jgi:hypothetical protein
MTRKRTVPVLASRLVRAAAAAALVAAVAPSALAQHAERCEAIPKDQWKPQAELERKLTDRGWKISRVKITNGCYEVYGKDEKGKSVETFFHPKTLDVVTAPK